ncbi:MAG: flagellar biosynthetic protein FliR [Desulfobacterota bacterium]|nr:flagellar biosynthetic protein FliR [Thermodesulfobacteriota bacterium]
MSGEIHLVNDLSRWTLPMVQQWLFVVVRVAPIVFLMPLFQSRNVPQRVKAAITLILSLVLFPSVAIEETAFPSEPVGFGLLVFSEMAIGLVLGLSIRMVFAGLQLAGEIAGTQMGFGMARVMDPQFGSESTVMTEFYFLIGLLLFLSVDGHHWFFRALAQSFQLIRPGGIHLQEGLFDQFLRLSGRMFVLAIQIVAPLLAILLLIKIALGIIARTMPQMNLLMASFPLTIGLGLIMIGLSLDLFWVSLGKWMDESGRRLVTTLLPLMKE